MNATRRTRLIAAAVVAVWIVSLFYCLTHWSTTVGPSVTFLANAVATAVAMVTS